MKITLDLNEKEIRALEVSLLEAKSSIHKMYMNEYYDAEKRAIDSEAVDCLCSALHAKYVMLDGIPEKLDEALSEK